MQESESKVQADIVKWARNVALVPRGCFFKITNEGKRNPRLAARYVAEGLVSGVPDLCLVYNSKITFFEVKAKKGKMDPKQIAVCKNLAEHGAQTHEVRSLQQFIEIFNTLYNENHIYPPGHDPGL